MRPVHEGSQCKSLKLPERARNDRSADSASKHVIFGLAYIITLHSFNSNFAAEPISALLSPNHTRQQPLHEAHCRPGQICRTLQKSAQETQVQSGLCLVQKT